MSLTFEDLVVRTKRLYWCNPFAVYENEDGDITCFMAYTASQRIVLTLESTDVAEISEELYQSRITAGRLWSADGRGEADCRLLLIVLTAKALLRDQAIRVEDARRRTLHEAYTQALEFSCS